MVKEPGHAFGASTSTAAASTHRAGTGASKGGKDTVHPGYQVLFYDFRDNSQTRNYGLLREVDWATVNCPVAWEVHGLAHPPGVH